MATPRTIAHTLNDVARQLAPHLRIISSSQPAPPLRTHNVIALADTAEVGRRAALALESIEPDDERLGAVVMGTTARESHGSPPGADPADARPDGAAAQLVPGILTAALLGAVVGAILIGAGAFLLGADPWEVVGAAAVGAVLVSVFDVIWLTFAGMGGREADRQQFVIDGAMHLTVVSLHTDDADHAAAARECLRKTRVPVLAVDRFGHVSGL